MCVAALCLRADTQYSLPWYVSLLAAIAISCIVLSVGSFPPYRVFCVNMWYYSLVHVWVLRRKHVI